MSRSVHFFATKSDIEPVLASVESRAPIQYVRAGMFDTPETDVLPTALHIPHLGLAPSGDHNLECCWLILEFGASVHVEAVPQRRGGTLYAIDQSMNPRSVAFTPGGVFENSCVVAGNVSTCTDGPWSEKLVALFARELRRRFRRIKSFSVGPEAERLLDAGYRLTSSVRSARECDLSRG